MRTAFLGMKSTDIILPKVILFKTNGAKEVRPLSKELIVYMGSNQDLQLLPRSIPIYILSTCGPSMLPISQSHWVIRLAIS